MKVLTKNNIRKRGKSLIKPFDGESCLTDVGYDLRVGEKIYFLNLGKEKRLKEEELVEIPPRERFAVESLEKVTMKSNMFALIATRISLLWQGLTSLGTKVDPMFQDKLILIFSNDSDTPLTLEYGQRICNIIFFEYEDPPEDIEIRKRPSFLPPPRTERIEDPINIEKIRQKYGSGIASVIQYLKPRLLSHDKRLKGLEKFKIAITTLAVAGLSSIIIGLITWLITK